MALNVYNLSEHIKGNTFAGRDFRLTRRVDESTVEPIDLTGATIIMQFRKDANSRVSFEFRTDAEPASMIINNPVNGEFKIPEQEIDACEGIYCYDTLVIFPDDIKKTYWKGTLPVVKGISRE